MQVEEVILYSHAGETRRLTFKPGKLNIISGISGTGKTAVLEIIHFCLGDEDDIRIPRPLITQVVAWFALRVRFGEITVFIARPSPELETVASNAVVLAVGADVPTPPLDDLEPNTTVQALNTYLGRLLGIEENVNVPPGATRPELEATIRHSLFYCFQRQYEIANPEFLFHRQTQPFIKTAIQDTMPYFLGAAARDQLEQQRHLRGLRQELRSARAYVDELRGTRAEALNRGLALVSEAREVGLIEDESDPRDVSATTALLRAAVDSKAGLPELTMATGRELARLERKRLRLSLEFRAVREEMELVRTLSAEDTGYGDVVTEQVARLSSIEILPTSSEVCPVCEQPTPGVLPSVKELNDLLTATSHKLEGYHRAAPQLQTVLADLQEQQSELRKRLEETQDALRALIAQREEVDRFRARLNAQSYARGRVAQYLGAVSEADETSIAAAELRVTQLEEEIRNVEERLSPEALRDRIDSILGVVGQDMQRWAQELHLEHADSPVRIHPTRLTVVADTPRGPIYLPEMGSGASWVGYHLVSHLALHKHFIEERRPVPRLIVLDQITQAFFPPERVPDNPMDHLGDDDRDRVRAMFALLASAVEELDKHLQIIVIDHARLPEQWFLESLRYDWHDGERLIPDSWIPNEIG